MARNYKGKGNVDRYQIELRRIADEIITAAEDRCRDRVVELALDTRDQAEANGRASMGHEPGGPEIHESWYASTVLPSDGNLPPGTRAGSAAQIASNPNARTIYVGNHAFTAWFHELGYHSGTGGARAKFMLKKALETVRSNAVERV